MILTQKGYSYNDLTIVPEVISDIESRSQCNPYIDEEAKLLPIFAAPMASVVDEKNMDVFLNNGITPVLPRNIALDVRMNVLKSERWVALSLKEFEHVFIDNAQSAVKNVNYHVCVDIANGHMRKLYDTCRKAKEIALTSGYSLTIMTGNIANPETYKYLCDNNAIYDGDFIADVVVDYIRVGIGSGAGCFVDGTKVKTNTGYKNIEDVVVGDKVLTIDNTYHSVIDTVRYKTNSLITINDEITSTINHRFYVIDKDKKHLITEENILKYGYWVSAENLNKDKHYLIKLK